MIAMHSDSSNLLVRMIRPFNTFTVEGGWEAVSRLLPLASVSTVSLAVQCYLHCYSNQECISACVHDAIRSANGAVIIKR